MVDPEVHNPTTEPNHPDVAKVISWFDDNESNSAGELTKPRLNDEIRATPVTEVHDINDVKPLDEAAKQIGGSVTGHLVDPDSMQSTGINVVHNRTAQDLEHDEEGFMNQVHTWWNDFGQTITSNSTKNQFHRNVQVLNKIYQNKRNEQGKVVELTVPNHQEEKAA